MSEGENVWQIKMSECEGTVTYKEMSGLRFKIILGGNTHGAILTQFLHMCARSGSGLGLGLMAAISLWSLSCSKRSLAYDFCLRYEVMLVGRVKRYSIIKIGEYGLGLQLSSQVEASRAHDT